MSSVNKVIIVGRIGKDPESKTFNSGGTITQFSIATSEKYKNKAGESMEDTQWHNCKCTSKLNEVIIKYVKKGMLVYVEGKLKTRKYEKNGVDVYVTEVVIDSLQMLSSVKGEETAPTAPISHDNMKCENTPDPKAEMTKESVNDRVLPF